jgi:hypothetical protein
MMSGIKRVIGWQTRDRRSRTVVGAEYLTMTELESGLDEIYQSPKDGGFLELIVCRPRPDERKVLAEGELHPILGLIGDCWKERGSSRTADGSAHPDMQLNVMNTRVAALVARSKDRWPLAGDQLYLDLDLSEENLPAGTRLVLGTAIIEVTAQPHMGCKKFVMRFGPEAMKFINSELGRRLRLRGLNAKVVEGGVIRVGQAVKKL